jgi:hypothetical protein
MQSTTQAGLKRLLHFAAVWDRLYSSELVQGIGKSESLLNSLQKIGTLTDELVQYKANAFVHKIPFINLEQITVDHLNLVKVCDPTKISNANYAAIMKFGNTIWVVSDKPAAPMFRQKLREVIEDHVPIIVTADRDSIMRLAEEARAAYNIFKSSGYSTYRPSTVQRMDSAVARPRAQASLTSKPVAPPARVVVDIEEEGDSAETATTQTKPAGTETEEGVIEVDGVPVQATQRTSYEVQKYLPTLPEEAKKKFAENLKKLDRECASTGKQTLQNMATLAFSLGATGLYFVPNESQNAAAVTSIRLGDALIPVGTLKMNTYQALSAVLRESHGLGKEPMAPPLSGNMTVRFQAAGRKYMFESTCTAVPFGTAGHYETFALSLRSGNIPALDEIYPEDSYLQHIPMLPGLTLIGSSLPSVRIGLMEGLLVPMAQDELRIAVMGLTSATGMRLPEESRPGRTAVDSMITLGGMDMDRVFVGNAPFDALPELTRIAAAGTVVVAGLNANSFAELFEGAMNKIGPTTFASHVRTMLYVDKVPLLCPCVKDGDKVGCSACAGTGFVSQQLFFDYWPITLAVREDILKKAGAESGQVRFHDVYSNPQVWMRVRELYATARITRDQALRLLHGNIGKLQEFDQG